jgi:hypothetical protein
MENEPKIDNLRQSEFEARTELRRQLLTGDPTGPTRAKIAEFSRSLQAEVARVKLGEEEKTAAKRRILTKGRHQMMTQFASRTHTEIADRMAPIAIPNIIQES